MKNYIDKTICIRAQFTQPLTICDDGSDCCNYIQIKYNQVIICDVISEEFSNETLNARVVGTNIEIIGFNINQFDIKIINFKRKNNIFNKYIKNINKIRKLQRYKNLILCKSNIVPGNYLYSRENWSTYQFVTVFLHEGKLYVKIGEGNYLVSGLPCDCIFVKTKKKFNKPISKYNNIFRSKVLFDKIQE